MLLHLATPSDWSAAQAAGAVHPLPAVGFVHLSTPEQVHLPAQRLFDHTDDLLLLVLDPDRLGAPVRWEPGVPGDPASMVFPHLYGPLPVSAVTTVVPWPRPRGPQDLPALD
ncbi:DUF952 domain-containing protein [Modestobacter sp. Leaf380]|uniref:DUF952 domain-containing protein n=1 Tax=Modestobacter sp. Leaf380 TaxID=1736356 RepID=UPI0006F2CB6F|nr:DUF952 domain-containing protein [Modestobacter sp. Leaf380]KQS73163.1 glutathione S-transferase [Modestobacter sp. Leaf380]